MTEKGRARKGKRTKIEGQFAWRLVEMLRSPAHRVLSLSAHRVLARLEIEMASHGGTDNGKLPVTFNQFEEYGIHRHAIAPAIREVVALGFVEITEVGRAGNAAWRRPTCFRLTYRHGSSTQPTDEWKKIETIEEAEAIVKDARADKKKHQWRKPHHNQWRKPHHNPDFCSAETDTTMCGAETTTTSISRGHSVGARVGKRRPIQKASASDPSATDHEPVGTFTPELLSSRLVKAGGGHR